MPAITRSHRVTHLAATRIESVRTVPPICAVLGMTLRAVPALSVVTESTTESNGSVSRETIAAGW